MAEQIPKSTQILILKPGSIVSTTTPSVSGTVLSPSFTLSPAPFRVNPSLAQVQMTKLVTPVPSTVHSPSTLSAVTSLSTSQNQKNPYSFKVKILPVGGRGGGKTFILRSADVHAINTVSELRSLIEKNFYSELGRRHVAEIGAMKNGSRVWFCKAADVQETIQRIMKRTDVTLWCTAQERDGTTSDDDNLSDSDSNSTSPFKKKARKSSSGKKKNTKDDRIEELIKNLKDEHGNAFTILQYRLWAEMVDVGTHESLESPPDVPAFLGKQTGSGGKRVTFATAVSELGTAIASAVSGKPVCLRSSTAGGDVSLSPSRKAEIRSKYIQQLRELHDLMKIGAIDQCDFDDQKSLIMGELGNI